MDRRLNKPLVLAMVAVAAICGPEGSVPYARPRTTTRASCARASA